MLYDIFALIVLYPAIMAAIIYIAFKLEPVICAALYIIGRALERRPRKCQ